MLLTWALEVQLPTLFDEFQRFQAVLDPGLESSPPISSSNLWGGASSLLTAQAFPWHTVRWITNKTAVLQEIVERFHPESNLQTQHQKA